MRFHSSFAISVFPEQGVVQASGVPGKPSGTSTKGQVRSLSSDEASSLHVFYITFPGKTGSSVANRKGGDSEPWNPVRHDTSWGGRWKEETKAVSLRHRAPPTDRLVKRVKIKLNSWKTKQNKNIEATSKYATTQNFRARANWKEIARCVYPLQGTHGPQMRSFPFPLPSHPSDPARGQHSSAPH